MEFDQLFSRFMKLKWPVVATWCWIHTGGVKWTVFLPKPRCQLFTVVKPRWTADWRRRKWHWTCSRGCKSERKKRAWWGMMMGSWLPNCLKKPYWYHQIPGAQQQRITTNKIRIISRNQHHDAAGCRSTSDISTADEDYCMLWKLYCCCKPYGGNGRL